MFKAKSLAQAKRGAPQSRQPLTKFLYTTPITKGSGPQETLEITRSTLIALKAGLSRDGKFLRNCTLPAGIFSSPLPSISREQPPAQASGAEQRKVVVELKHVAFESMSPLWAGLYKSAPINVLYMGPGQANIQKNPQLYQSHGINASMTSLRIVRAV